MMCVKALLHPFLARHEKQEIKPEDLRQEPAPEPWQETRHPATGKWEEGVQHQHDSPIFSKLPSEVRSIIWDFCFDEQVFMHLRPRDILNAEYYTPAELEANIQNVELVWRQCLKRVAFTEHTTFVDQKWIIESRTQVKYAKNKITPKDLLCPCRNPIPDHDNERNESHKADGERLAPALTCKSAYNEIIPEFLCRNTSLIFFHSTCLTRIKSYVPSRSTRMALRSIRVDIPDCPSPKPEQRILVDLQTGNEVYIWEETKEQTSTTGEWNDLWHALASLPQLETLTVNMCVGWIVEWQTKLVEWQTTLMDEQRRKLLLEPIMAIKHLQKSKFAFYLPVHDSFAKEKDSSWWLDMMLLPCTVFPVAIGQEPWDIHTRDLRSAGILWPLVQREQESFGTDFMYRQYIF